MENNATMEMIKNQNAIVITEDVYRLILDVAEAKPKSFKMSAALDLFVLGALCMKRQLTVTPSA